MGEPGEIVQDAWIASLCRGWPARTFKSAFTGAAAVTFCRGWLADAVSERDEGFHPFDRWSQIADHL
jgi:hypothetical protein